MGAGYPYPIVPPLPEYERRTETTRPVVSTNEEERKLTPEQIEAQGRQDAILHAQTLLADQERQQRQGETDIKADIAKQTADQAAAIEKQRNDAMQEAQKAIDAHRQRVEAKQAEYDATPSPRFFQEGETWKNALRAVGAGIAGVGDAIVTGAAIRAGHAPPSIDTVGQIIEHDLNRQRERIAKLKDSVVMAQTGLKDAEEARRQLLADVELKGATAYDRLAKVGAARLAAQGQKQPDIETNKEILGLMAKREEARQKALEPLHQTISKHVEGVKTSVAETNRVPTSATKAPTESQAKLADLSAGMLAELKTIGSLPALTHEELAKVQDNQLRANAADSATTPLGTAGAVAGRAVGLVPRTKYDGLSPEAQRSMNAWDALVELRARQLTGAGMPEQEAIREARTLGYSPGDSPAVMQQKIKRLEDAAQRGIDLSGNAGAKVAPQPPAGASAPPASTGAPTQPPPFQPGAVIPQAAPAPAAPPAPPPTAAPSPAPRPIAAQIAHIQQLLKSPEAKKPENRAKVKALIARMRELQGGE